MYYRFVFFLLQTHICSNTNCWLRYRHAEDAPAALPAPFDAGEEVDAGTGRGGRGRGGFPHAAMRGHLQRPYQALDKAVSYTHLGI